MIIPNNPQYFLNKTVKIEYDNENDIIGEVIKVYPSSFILEYKTQGRFEAGEIKCIYDKILEIQEIKFVTEKEFDEGDG